MASILQPAIDRKLSSPAKIRSPLPHGSETSYRTEDVLILAVFKHLFLLIVEVRG